MDKWALYAIVGMSGLISWHSNTARHNIRFRRDNDAWTTVHNHVGSSLELGNFKFGVYDVEVTAINVLGIKSEVATLTKSVTGIAYELATPTGLALEGAYTTSYIKAKWNKVPGATGYTVRVVGEPAAPGLRLGPTLP